MSKRCKLLTCSLALILFCTAAPIADAFIFVSVPLFPKIASCGTVVIVDQTMPFPGGDPEGGCLAWEADSGGVYLVGGIEGLAPGTRVFVKGKICTICLTTCAASAILDAQLSGCN